MTFHRAKELLPIIKAFSEGKSIEYKSANCDEWRTVINLCTEDDDTQYRIRDTSCFTYEDKNMLIGRCIKSKVDESMLLITGVVTEGIFANGCLIPWRTLDELWVFGNGTPCHKDWR